MEQYTGFLSTFILQSFLQEKQMKICSGRKFDFEINYQFKQNYIYISRKPTWAI